LTKYPILKNAPITEALLDIQLKLPKDFNIIEFKSVGKEISDLFPKEELRKRIENKIDIKDGEHTITTNEKLDGYRYISDDKSKIVQLRIDGFTFNKLKPYNNWIEFREEAMSLWEKYIDIVTPELIHRVALRYINNLNIPLQITDLGDYLVSPPIIPKGLPIKLSSFLNRLVIPEESTKSVAIITQALGKVVENSTSLPIILDIDVYKVKQDGFNDKEIWNTLEILRKFKNQIFFSSITDKLKEVYL